MPPVRDFLTTQTENVPATSNTMIKAAMAAVNTQSMMSEIVEGQDLPDGTDQITIPLTGRVHVNSWDEGTLLRESIVPETDYVTFTVSKYGGMSVVTDETYTDSTAFNQSRIGIELGNAMTRRIDEVLLSQITNFTTDKDGTAGINVVDITEMEAIVSTNRDDLFGPLPPGESVKCVMHPLVLQKMFQNSVGLGGAMTNGNLFNNVPIPSGISEDAIKEWVAGQTVLGGIPILRAQNQSYTTGAGANSTVGVFAQSAIMHTRKLRTETKYENIIRQDTHVTVVKARFGAKRFKPVYGSKISNAPALNVGAWNRPNLRS